MEEIRNPAWNSPGDRAIKSIYAHIEGLIDIDWEKQRVFLQTRKFFESIPLNTPGLIIERYDTEPDVLFPLKVSIKIAGVIFYTLIYHRDYKKYFPFH